MTEHRPEELSPADLALLKHVREHSSSAPSAAMDALILKAAAAAVRPPSVWQRIQQRLLATKPNQRWGWSLSLASVATIGLSLSLSMRTHEQPEALYDQALPAPMQYSAPQSAAPASAPALVLKKQSPQAPAPAKSTVMPQVKAKAERQVIQPQAEVARKSSAEKPAVSLAEDVAMPAAQADAQDQSAGYAASAPPALTLPQALQQILLLRRQGAADEAQKQLLALKKRYPQADVERQLQQLEALETGTETGLPQP